MSAIHSHTEGYQIDAASGCSHNACFFPNCQCVAPPKRITPLSREEQLNFLAGMIKVLEASETNQVVISSENLPLIKSIYEDMKTIL